MLDDFLNILKVTGYLTIIMCFSGYMHNKSFVVIMYNSMLNVT